MKNEAASDKAQAAQEAFDRWFNRSGHWVYRDREHALATWQAQGIQGLQAFVARPSLDRPEIRRQIGALALARSGR